MTLETKSRSLAKALSWRLSGSTATTLIVWLFTRRLELALGVGAIEIFGKMLLYFIHERIWARIPIGRDVPPARTILVKGEAGPERSRMVATIRTALQRRGLAGYSIGDALCPRSHGSGSGQTGIPDTGALRPGIDRLRNACTEAGLCLIGESDCDDSACPACTVMPDGTCLVVEFAGPPSASPGADPVEGVSQPAREPETGLGTVWLNGNPISKDRVGREIASTITTGLRR